MATMTDTIPLILDDDMAGMAGNVPVGLGDVDDVGLFGGPVDLGLTTHGPPLSKQLQLRVDEQRIRGCCQYVLLPAVVAVLSHTDLAS